MEEAAARLAAGDLAGARQLVVERVRSSPRDRDARAFLFQLFCVLTLWDKAATALAAFVAIAPDARAFADLYGSLITAERERAKIWDGQAPFRAHGEAPPWFADLLDAMTREASGDTEGALIQRADALALAPPASGRIDGQDFADLEDADDRLGPALELIVEGRYGLVPLAGLQGLMFQGPPQNLRDLVWAPVRFSLKGGQPQTGFIPVRYPGLGEADAPPLLLGRETQWRDLSQGRCAGEGQRILLSGESDWALLDHRRIEFN